MTIYAGCDPGTHGAVVFARLLEASALGVRFEVVWALAFDATLCDHCGAVDWRKIESEVKRASIQHGVTRVGLEVARQAGIPNRQRAAGIMRRIGLAVDDAQIIGAKAWWRTGRLKYREPKESSFKTCQLLSTFRPVVLGANGRERESDGLADAACLARWEAMTNAT